MNALKTPVVRCCCAASIAALALALPVHAGTVTLGTSGWEAHWDSSLDGRVDIDFIAFENNTIFVQKSAEFTQGPVNGVFPTIAITFRQVGDSTATHLVMEDEIVTNNTGATWTGFVMKTIDHGDATFNPALTAASGGGGPIGWSIAPFTTAEFNEDSTKLKISGGLVANGDQWSPGGGASDGQLWMDITSGDENNRQLFTFKERPTNLAVPGPSALLCLAGGLALVRNRRRVTK